MAIAAATPARASGKPINCSTVAATYSGLITKQTFPVGDAGSVVLERDAVNDGLIVGKITTNAGWHRSDELTSGPKCRIGHRSRTRFG